MMEGVDINLLLTIQTMKNRVFCNLYAVSLFCAICILRVLHVGLNGDILSHLTTKGDGKSLNTPADAKNRYLTIICQTGNHQLWEISLLVDTSQTWRGFIASKERVDIATSTKDKCIDTIESIN